MLVKRPEQETDHSLQSSVEMKISVALSICCSGVAFT
jgi:hypothetical protein